MLSEKEDFFLDRIIIIIEIAHNGVRFIRGISFSEKIEEKKENKIRIPPEKKSVKIKGNHLLVVWMFMKMFIEMVVVKRRNVKLEGFIFEKAIIGKIMGLIEAEKSLLTFTLGVKGMLLKLFCCCDLQNHFLIVLVDLLYFKLFFFLMVGFVLFKWDYYLMIVMNIEFVYFVLFYLMLVFSGALFLIEFVVYFFLVFVIRTVRSLVFLIYLVRGKGSRYVNFFS